MRHADGSNPRSRTTHPISYAVQPTYDELLEVELRCGVEVKVEVEVVAVKGLAVAPPARSDSMSVST